MDVFVVRATFKQVQHYPGKSSYFRARRKGSNHRDHMGRTNRRNRMGVASSSGWMVIELVSGSNCYDSLLFGVGQIVGSQLAKQRYGIY